MQIDFNLRPSLKQATLPCFTSLPVSPWANSVPLERIARVAQQEPGSPLHEIRNRDSIVGRWAGDRVVLVGDYDESKLWDELPTYRNISKEVVETWNRFIELDDMQLEYRPGCSCST